MYIGLYFVEGDTLLINYFIDWFVKLVNCV